MDLSINSNMSEKREKEEVLQLIKSLQKGLKQFTLKEFNEALNTVVNNPAEDQKNKEKHIALILDLICEEYGLTGKELIYGKIKGSVQEARNITYCILHFHLKLPIRYIANKVFFLKWHNSVGVAIQYYKSLNCNIKTDKEFKDKLDKIQQSAISNLKQNKV